MEKIIELTPVAEMGKGSARITDNFVEIAVSGIAGGMKVWLVGGEEAQKVGNIVDGKLKKQADTTRHNSILITQSGRQVFIGNYRDKDSYTECDKPEEGLFLNGMKLRKITQKNYGNLCEELRYILSNREVYRNYKKYGYYCAGENSQLGALALKYDESEENPFARFGEYCIYKDGFVIVCVDKKSKKIKKVSF